jgi:hypothetical protein
MLMFGKFSHLNSKRESSNIVGGMSNLLKYKSTTEVNFNKEDVFLGLPTLDQDKKLNKFKGATFNLRNNSSSIKYNNYKKA